MFTLEALGIHADTIISEVKVGNNSKKIIKSIFHAYKKASYFEEIYPMLQEILLNKEKNLAKYVGYSIERVAQDLDMDTKLIYLSDLQGETSLMGQDRTVDICKRLNADQFINAIGGQELYSKDRFYKEGVVLNFLKTEDIEYKQFNNNFVPNLSIIDIMMFNPKDEIVNILKRFTLI